MADEFGADFCVDDEDGFISDTNLEIPTNLEWIYSKNGRAFFLQVLQTVSVPESVTVESKAARIMSTKYKENIEVVTDFLKQMSKGFSVCYQNVEQIKCPSKKMMKLERSITTLHDDAALNGKWSSLLRSFDLQISDGTNILFSHILQHFWSSLVLKGEHEESEESEELNIPTSSCSSTSTITTEVEVQSVKDHAGWVFKRVRDEFKSGPEKCKIQMSKTNTTVVEVDKHHILALIQRLGQDVLDKPGKFLFDAVPEVVEVFMYLHTTVECIVKDQLKVHGDKDILKKCLKLLSEDMQLRKLWYKVLGDEDNDNFKAASLLLLQQAVAFFVKSKQQIIREQLQLKPTKQSSSLRQSLSNIKNSKPKPAKERKQLSQSDEYVKSLRQNPTNVSEVKEFLTNAFAIPAQTPGILKKLHGQELTCILQSLGLPGLNGKAKQRQIEILIKHNVDGKQWNIIFPDKLQGKENEK